MHAPGKIRLKSLTIKVFVFCSDHMHGIMGGMWVDDTNKGFIQEICGAKIHRMSQDENIIDNCS